MTPTRLVAIGLIAAAIVVGAWLAISGSEPQQPTGPQTQSNVRDKVFPGMAQERREGLEKILAGMQANGARPEQIANIESKLDRLDG